MLDHTLTIEFDGYVHTTLNCHAPAESYCHAVFDCGCESWTWEGVKDGKPTHLYWLDGDEEHVHTGRFDPDVCNLRDWHENSDEDITGEITVPVREEWTDGGYLFDITPDEPVATTVDREAVARTLFETTRIGDSSGYTWVEMDGTVTRDHYLRLADAVLSLLPATVKPDREWLARHLAEMVWAEPEDTELWAQMNERTRDEWRKEADAVLAAWPGKSEAEIRADERERIAREIEARYLGPDAGRSPDGRDSPDAHLIHAYDEGLQEAADIAREGGRTDG